MKTKIFFFGMAFIIIIMLIVASLGKIPKTDNKETENEAITSRIEDQLSRTEMPGKTTSEKETSAKATDTPETSETASQPSTTKKISETTETGKSTSTVTTSVRVTSAGGSTTSSVKNEYEYAYAGFNPKTALIDKNNWNLLLVNRDYILPENFEVNLAPALSGSYSIDSRVVPEFKKMYNAAKEDGLTLTVVSGYRSISSQKSKFENKINYYVNQGYTKVKATQLAAESLQPPGCSEHNTGLATDLCYVDRSFENSSEFKWLEKHAADYGFILRYPENKTGITKVKYEPWHWRYVGTNAAKAIKNSGKCLEEYLGKA